VRAGIIVTACTTPPSTTDTSLDSLGCQIGPRLPMCVADEIGKVVIFRCFLVGFDDAVKSGAISF
jgi:hypothetical protein